MWSAAGPSNPEPNAFMEVILKLYPCGMKTLSGAATLYWIYSNIVLEIWPVDQSV